MQNSKTEGKPLTDAQRALLHYFEHEHDPHHLREALYTVLFLTTEDAVNHDMINGAAFELWRLHELSLAL